MALIASIGVLSVATVIAALIALSVSDETVSLAEGPQVEVADLVVGEAQTAAATTGTTLHDPNTSPLVVPDETVTAEEPSAPIAQILANATGQIQPRTAFLARNTAYDNVQYQDLPASEVPTSAGENPNIIAGGNYGVSFLDNEFGPGGSDAKIETGSAFRT